jgi:hypothetical protein
LGKLARSRSVNESWMLFTNIIGRIVRHSNYRLIDRSRCDLSNEIRLGGEAQIVGVKVIHQSSYIVAIESLN